MSKYRIRDIHDDEPKEAKHERLERLLGAVKASLPAKDRDKAYNDNLEGVRVPLDSGLIRVDLRRPRRVLVDGPIDVKYLERFARNYFGKVRKVDPVVDVIRVSE